jgi:hypothetical protein
MNAVWRRLEDRRQVLAAHMEMLLEADARGEGMDVPQLDLVHSEMVWLADMACTLRLLEIRDTVRSDLAVLPNNL